MTQDKADNSSQGGFSSFIGKIKGVLLEDEPPTRVSVPPPTQMSPAPAVAPASSTNSVANPLVDSLMQVAMSKTTAYTALVEAIIPLEAFIPDESSRFKAAFAIVGKTRTIEQIVQAIDMQHLQAIDGEVQRFNGQARSKEDEEVNTRMREIDSLRSQIESDTQETVKLRKQIEQRLQELQANTEIKKHRIAEIEQEVSGKREALAKVNRQFTEAVTLVKDRLLQSKEKVVRYLSA